MEFKDKIYFSKGKRSIVYLAEYNGKKVIIKYSKRAEIESYWLNFLKNLDFVPKLIYHDEEQLVYYFIDGITIGEYIEKTKNPQPILKQILKQCYELDKLKVNKLELVNPYKHILIKNKKARMIDFERCKRTEKPKNVTQFVEYLMRKNIISREDIKPLLKNYKKSQTRSNFGKILKLFS